MADDNTIITAGAALVAVVVAVVVLAGDRAAAASPTEIVLPTDSGSSSDDSPGPGQTVDEDTPGATPSDPDDDGSAEWQVPDSVDDGGGGDSLWAGEGTGFNPGSRADLVDQDGGTWVGL
jgi:hypothetical protein